MDVCIHSLGDATFFSKMDANSGYWPVEVTDEDGDKKSFTSQHGLFLFIRKPFTLKRAQNTTTRDVHHVMLG